MTFAPQRLLQLRDYLHQQTGLPFVSLGIVGDSAHRGGFHCGRDRLITNDYSNRTARDRAGLTEAASASDTGNFRGLVALTKWAVGEARAGRRPDTREIIGPWSDGRAYRFDHLGGWAAQLRARGDSHESHMHESWYRDSEGRDKIRFYRPFFEEDDDMATAKEVWDYNIPPGADISEYSEDKAWRALSILRSTQTWAYRATKEARKSRAENKAILDAVGGLDTDAILAAIDRRAAEDVARDAALMELVEQGQSGQLAADEVVRLIGAKLSAAATAEGGA